MKETRKTSRRIVGVALAVVSLILLDQLLLHTALADGRFLDTDLAPFAPPLFSGPQRELLALYERQLGEERERFDHETLFDAELGWCPRPGMTRGQAEYDWAGSRIGNEPLPRERVQGTRTIAAMGCSFTHGHEVAGKNSWVAQLERRWPDVAIGNFGVGGYGVDQVLLHYRRDVAPLEPDEVWLGFFPGAALRVTSRFPPLYQGWRGRMINFKPCFSVGADGELELHPSPAHDPGDIPRLLHDPQAFLDALGDRDSWIERARPAYQPLGSHWIHYSAVGRILLTAYERGGREIAPLLSDTGGELFRLNRALILTLAREVEAAGARFRLIVLPGGIDLEGLTREGAAYWSPLIASLRAEGIEVLDPSPFFLREQVDMSAEFWMPGGHYTPRSHELVTDAIASYWGP